MCGGRSDDSSQDTSGSYNEAAQNYFSANPSYPSSGNYSARSASSIGMANQSFAGGLNEGQDGTPIGNFGMGEGQGNVNFSGATSDDGFAYDTPTFGNRGPNVSVTNFRSGNLYGGYEDDPAYDADIFGRRGGPTDAAETYRALTRQAMKVGATSLVTLMFQAWVLLRTARLGGLRGS